MSSLSLRTWGMVCLAVILAIAVAFIYRPGAAPEPPPILPIANAPADLPGPAPVNVPVLAAALQQADAPRAVAAAITLGQTRSPEAVAPLLTAASTDTRPEVQAAALSGLTALRPPIDPIPIMRVAEQSPDPAVRAAALDYLAAQKVRAAVAIMLKNLDDPDVVVRGRAYSGIKRLVERDYDFRANDPPEKRAIALARIRRDVLAYRPPKGGNPG